MNRSVPYQDRRHAGAILGAALRERVGSSHCVVLGLPRGGVPVGFEVASALDAPLDVLPVRKLGVPDQPELAMGAIAAGGFKVLDTPLIAELGLHDCDVARVLERETAELHRREALYRGQHPAMKVKDRVAILVDDGLATGFTMRAAIAAVRAAEPRELLVAVPVGAPETCAVLARDVSALICPLQPSAFRAVGFWYDDFEPTTDREVTECLAAARVKTEASSSFHRRDTEPPGRSENGAGAGNRTREASLEN